MIIVKGRELLIPENERYIGTTYDDNSTVRTFRISRFHEDGMDKSQLDFYVIINYDDDSDPDAVGVVKSVSDDYIVLEWDVGEDVTDHPGCLYLWVRGFDHTGTVRWSSFPGVFYIEGSGTAPTDLSNLEQRIAQEDKFIRLAKLYRGHPMTAATAAEMINRDQIYVYIGNEAGYNYGHWYFWDGSAWTPGGVYNAVAVHTDNDLIAEGVPADARATGEKLIHRYDTVAQMKADTTLGTGMYARTGGYHAVNDGGGALYRIYGTVPSTHYESLNNGRYAELIVKDSVTPEMYGAYGNGSRNDTQALINAFNSGKPVHGNPEKTYVGAFGGSIYETGVALSGGFKLHGGNYRLSGRIDYSDDISITDCTVTGNVFFTGNNFTGKTVTIERNVFDVGELCFRLNNADFDIVSIKNNTVRFYGAFWSSTQAAEQSLSKGNVYIFRNKFTGKRVSAFSESYYCACATENDYVEFAGNTCVDFVTTASEKSVHDGYFSSRYVYVHDNVVSNLDGNNQNANAILKAKSSGKRIFANNRYDITSSYEFPIIQVQDADSDWLVTGCIFNVNKVKPTDVADLSGSNGIIFSNCTFNVGTLTGTLMQNMYNMLDCIINVGTLKSGVSVLSLRKGIVKNVVINVTTRESESDYAIYGYASGSLDTTIIDSIKTNIPLTKSFISGTIKRCELVECDQLGQVIDCINKTRWMRFQHQSGKNLSFTALLPGDIFVGQHVAKDQAFSYLNKTTQDNFKFAWSSGDNMPMTIFSIASASDTYGVPINVIWS